jgi:hypothetical protein
MNGRSHWNPLFVFFAANGAHLSENIVNAQLAGNAFCFDCVNVVCYVIGPLTSRRALDLTQAPLLILNRVVSASRNEWQRKRSSSVVGSRFAATAEIRMEQRDLLGCHIGQGSALH